MNLVLSQKRGTQLEGVKKLLREVNLAPPLSEEIQPQSINKKGQNYLSSKSSVPQLAKDAVLK